MCHKHCQRWRFTVDSVRCTTEKSLFFLSPILHYCSICTVGISQWGWDCYFDSVTLPWPVVYYNCMWPVGLRYYICNYAFSWRDWNMVIMPGQKTWEDVTSFIKYMDSVSNCPKWQFWSLRIGQEDDGQPTIKNRIKWHKVHFYKIGRIQMKNVSR